MLFAIFLWVQLDGIYPNPNRINASSAAHLIRTEYIAPHPSLSPQEVVEIQIIALQENDEPSVDFGVRKVYNFSSPENKEAIGNLKSYIQMLHNPVYKSLLNHRIYGLDDIRLVQDLAFQKVTLIDAEDKPAVFVFQLSLQEEEPYLDCWMIDKVMKY